jgi:glycosyltransferase involved in cell wall biosynthesis
MPAVATRTTDAIQSAVFTAVVPTWNESAWLPRLLRLLVASPLIRDVVIADNASGDGTGDIARSYRCKVVSGGFPGEARNIGARHASSPYLLFADADVLFSGDVLAVAAKHLRDPSVAAVHFRVAPITGGWFIRVSYRVLNGYLRGLDRVGLAQGVGSFIAVRRDSFNAVGGFREELEAGEDADFFRRVSRVGEVRLDRSMTVYVSSRRFRVEHPLVFAGKTCLWGILRLLGLRVSLIPYRWVTYPTGLATHERDLADRCTRIAAGDWLQHGE